jgi:hypothetical protein
MDRRHLLHGVVEKANPFTDRGDGQSMTVTQGQATTSWMTMIRATAPSSQRMAIISMVSGITGKTAPRSSKMARIRVLPYTQVAPRPAAAMVGRFTAWASAAKFSPTSKGRIG